MLLIYKAALYSHILLGCLALVIFWIPVLARKGGPLHKNIGKHYARLMYFIGISGTICCLLILIDPLTIREVTDLAGKPLQDFLDQNRQSAMFLLMLSILTITTTYHGIQVLAAKANREKLRNIKHLGLITCLVIASLITLWLGFKSSNTLLLIFSLFGLFLSANNLYYIFKPTMTPRGWMIAHLGSMCGTGIAVYTAFGAVGGRYLLIQLFGQEALIFSWIAPGAIGGFGIALASRRLRKQQSAIPAPI